MKTRKVGIIGLGHVGAHVAYSLAVQGIADELVLVDSNEKKVESEPMRIWAIAMSLSIALAKLKFCVPIRIERMK